MLEIKKLRKQSYNMYIYIEYSIRGDIFEQLEEEYLTIVIGQFKHFKERAEQGIQQLTEEEIHWRPSEESNNIAIIIKHLSGNMHSRWVGFLTTDGEKAYRDRDLEFIDDNNPRNTYANLGRWMELTF